MQILRYELDWDDPVAIDPITAILSIPASLRSDPRIEKAIEEVKGTLQGWAIALCRRVTDEKAGCFKPGLKQPCTSYTLTEGLNKECYFTIRFMSNSTKKPTVESTSTQPNQFQNISLTSVIPVVRLTTQK